MSTEAKPFTSSRICLITVAGLANMVDFFRIWMARELFNEKKSTPSDWEVNFRWLIDCASLAELLIEDNCEGQILYRSRINAVVDYIQSASTVLDLDDDSHPAEERMRFSRQRVEEALKILTSWLDEETVGNMLVIEAARLENYAEVACAAAEQSLYRPGYLKQSMESVLSTINYRIRQIREILDSGDASGFEASNKLASLQNLLCMSLRECILAVPARVFFGEASEAKQLIEDCRAAHQEAIDSVPTFSDYRLQKSIVSRIEFCERLVEYGDTSKVFFDRPFIGALIEEFHNVDQ